MIKRYFKRLKTEFKGYNAGKFGKDVLAGITVAAVALPLALMEYGRGATCRSRRCIDDRNRLPIKTYQPIASVAALIERLGGWQ